jgi:hypothetical protein
VNIRELSLLERVPSLMDELNEACKKGTQIQIACPHLASDVCRKANALKASIEALKTALEKSDGSPPLNFLKDRPPLWSRLNDHPELREIARLVRHDGCHQDDFEALMKDLREKYGSKRACEAMMELTCLDVARQWVTMRPSVLRACRIVTGPPPGDPDHALYWSTRGGPPRPRSPDDPRPLPTPASGEEATPHERELPKEERPARRTRRKKEAG